MPRPTKILGALLAGLTAVAIMHGPGLLRAEDEDRLMIQIEALKRLKDANLDERPAIKQALLRVLDQVQGRPAFVELVREFQLKDRNPALLDFALAKPADPMAPEALRVMLAHEGSPLIQRALQNPSTTAVLLDPLGRTADPRAVPLLLPIVGDAARDIALRRSTLRSLPRTQEGARAILELARASKLPADLRLIAATELANVRWRAVRDEAANVIPPPSVKGDRALPPVAELVKKAGDATRGAGVFRKPEINCIGCHQVGAEGVDFGPKLTEIGTKLGKDAIYESILDPSQGISFGFEAWLVVLKNGDELFGLIVSETGDELTLKLQGGQAQVIRKADIARREKQAQSIMPAGLQAAMTQEELVDLVEYLASLKKAAN